MASKTKSPALGDWVKATAKDTPNPNGRKLGNYKLTPQAQKLLNKTMREIRKGIKNVCELHTFDENPSLSQADFEEQYIYKLLGLTANAIKLSVQNMTASLTAQYTAGSKPDTK